MSSRHKTDRDHLDLYIGWCLKNFASHTPPPIDAKRRLLRTVAASTSSTVEQAINPLSVLRVFKRLLVRALTFIEKDLVFGPLPTEEELALSYAFSQRVPIEFKTPRQSISHLCPTAIGYFCLIN